MKPQLDQDQLLHELRYEMTDPLKTTTNIIANTKLADSNPKETKMWNEYCLVPKPNNNF